MYHTLASGFRKVYLDRVELNILKQFNNFRLSDPETRICSPNTSAKANTIYLENRYPPRKICQRPCTDMNLRLALQSRREDTTNPVQLTLYTDIEVYSEVMPKTFLTLVAEVGGYLGLTLGVSLLDLKVLVSSLWTFSKARLE